ncbi:MAG: GNAT family N-acetyltransferase [Mobilicoccus sp.]|nr:GNAT family N-acetyltransferase [Mobilicoccus sp.]
MIDVRLADGNDRAGVGAVGRSAWQTTYSEIFPPELMELFLAKWWTKDANISSIRRKRTFVADDAGRIVGMASYGVHEGDLVVWKIYVLPEYQGRGVGGRLLAAVYDQDAGAHDACHLSFTDGNSSAHEFSVRHGYVVDHREEQSGLPDLVWMRKDLTRSDEGQST